MTASPSDTRFCSVCARQAGLDPGGYGGAAYDLIIAAELSLPWPLDMFADAARMPRELLALMQHIRDTYARTHTVSIRPLGVAPDPDYSVAGRRRVICWQRPTGPFARFMRSEYCVPEEQLGPLVYALALAPEQLELFAAYRQEQGDVRDLLVCTHGNVDAACSKFGYPTYRLLRGMAAESGGALRAWRTTHFGGHVFAPTLIDMPHGSYWAYIEHAEAELLAQRSGDPTRLRRHYRGWAGLPAPFLQVLDRELFVQHGWRWLDYAKTGCVLAQDETSPPDEHGHVQPAWAEVRLDYRTPEDATAVVYARIERVGFVESISNTGNPHVHAYPQYAVAWMRTER